jgi:hypothetical protein
VAVTSHDSPKTHLLLQMHTRVLNGELEQTFQEGIPARAEGDEKLKKAVSLTRFCMLSRMGFEPQPDGYVELCIWFLFTK